MFLVVAMLGVEEVCELANLVFLVNEADFGIMQVSMLELLFELMERVRKRLPKAAVVFAVRLRDTGCHCGIPGYKPLDHKGYIYADICDRENGDGEREQSRCCRMRG